MAHLAGLSLPVKLELAAGSRPTRGYTHNDAFEFHHIEVVGDPWMLELPDRSVDEVLALAFVEHLTYEQALDTFRNVYRMLAPNGLFLFDVPDYPVWVGYYLAHMAGDDAPLPLDHVRKTLFGWQRWPGDEHKYGWDRAHLSDALRLCGFTIHDYDVRAFQSRVFRQRFHRPVDAHLYVVAKK
jgi:predicted SAM-dependent methyltransferase